MKIIGTGLSGLIGSRISELLKDKYEFINFSTSTGFDITKKDSILDFFNSSQASVVIHLAGKTDVDGCEEDKDRDLEILEIEELGKQQEEFEKINSAWSVNVIGTKNIADVCAKTNKKLIYISSDFVFDGEKKDPYAEDDMPNPINWYGRTKHEGEKIVGSLDIPWAILRISYPYRAHFQKKDFVRTIMEKLSDGESLKVVSDQIITPTFIDDLAFAFDQIIQNNLSGIYHTSGSDSLSPFEITRKIADIFGFDKTLISETTSGEFYKDRARRPSNLALKNDKIVKLGASMKGIEGGLQALKRQL
ncbi:MAG: SDR family oxidoreductase [Patescibacteria group bacterium]